MVNFRIYGRNIAKGPEKRELHEYKSRRLREFPEFANSDPRILNAQWISAIDKIIKKPSRADKGNSRTGNELRKQQIDFRRKLGAACWQLLPHEIKNPELEKNWNWKLQPCGTDANSFNNEKLKSEKNITGRWYQAFLGDTSPKDVDFDDLAVKIQKHLFEREIRKFDGKQKAHHPNKDDVSKPRGLVERRAESIAGNSLAAHMQKMFTDDKLKTLAQETQACAWRNEDEATFTTNGDLAKEIFDLTKEKEKNKKHISVQDASTCIFKHYGKTFGDKPRIKITEEQPGLLNLYDAVRNYYRTFLKNTKKGTTGFAPLSRTLPPSNDALFRLLKSRDTNAITNDLIRLGRVMHYESTDKETDKESDGFGVNDISDVWTKDVASFSYWSTTGQDDIKRTEAFVRVWRNCLTMAARTAKNLVDPNTIHVDPATGKKINTDVLDDGAGKILSENAEAQKRFFSSLPLLFGEQSELFNNTNPEDLVYGSLRILAKLRNENFHFKGRRTFVKNLKNKINPKMKIGKSSTEFPEEISEALKCLHKQDHEGRLENLKAEIRAAHIPNFVGNGEDLKKFYTQVESPSEVDLTLPKFSRLLNRIANTDVSKSQKLKWNFPNPANQNELKQHWALAKFIAFKLIYEAPFKSWLDEQTSEVITQFATDAKSTRTKSAREINRSDSHKDLLEAKTAILPLPQKGSKLAVYIQELQAFNTSEMREQSGYEPDAEKAREAMAFVDEHVLDIVARAFEKYLEGKKDKYGTFLNLNSKSSEESNPAKFPQGSEPFENGTDKDWLSFLYFALHFVPVDDVSQLLHQFRKWGVLESKATKSSEENPDVKAIKKVFELYLAMHDAKHDGSGGATDGLQPFRDLFEKAEDFNRVFKTEGSNDHQLASTRRGLREIMRFGHLAVLQKAIGTNRIQTSEVDELLKLDDGGSTSVIATAQQKRKDLHKKWVDGNRQLENSDKVEYEKLLVKINQHRHLANQVRLNYHIKLHRLLLRVMSRLVDFAGLWERDGYFISLALMRLHGKKLHNVFTKEGDHQEFKEQGKLPKCPDNIEGTFAKTQARFHTIKLHQKRNDIAHFNDLNGNDIDLTALCNNVRELMSYDRKLKNAVTKSIINILQQEGLKLTWDMKDHKLCDAKVETNTITHLQNKGPKENLHHENYVKMVQQLFAPNHI